MGKKKPKEKAVKIPSRILGMSDEQRARAMIETCTPLLEMFSDLDAVFTEDDAMMKDKRQISLGRVYESWKRTRAKLDPDWDPKAESRRPMGSPSVFHPT